MEIDINITTMSSKGQIVIPSSMREDFQEGEKFVIIKRDKQLILKTVKDFDKNIEKDLIFAKRTEEAYKRHEKGDFKKMSAKKFVEELDKW